MAYFNYKVLMLPKDLIVFILLSLEMPLLSLFQSLLFKLNSKHKELKRLKYTGIILTGVSSWTGHFVCMHDYFKYTQEALVRWLSWWQHCPMHQKVVGSIPTQGIYLGSGLISHQGRYRKQPIDVFLSRTDISLSISLSPCFSF